MTSQNSLESIPYARKLGCKHPQNPCHTENQNWQFRKYYHFNFFPMIQWTYVYCCSCYSYNCASIIIVIQNQWSTFFERNIIKLNQFLIFVSKSKSNLRQMNKLLLLNRWQRCRYLFHHHHRHCTVHQSKFRRYNIVDLYVDCLTVCEKITCM